MLHQKEGLLEVTVSVSQFHSLIEIGSELWRSSCPNLQNSLQSIAKDHVQMVFDYLQGWRPHKLSGEPVPVLSHPHN